MPVYPPGHENKSRTRLARGCANLREKGKGEVLSMYTCLTNVVAEGAVGSRSETARAESCDMVGDPVRAGPRWLPPSWYSRAANTINL